METAQVVKSVAKGLALGILWPTAATVVLAKRANKWVGDLGVESLDLARQWEDTTEKAVRSGFREAKDSVQDYVTLKTDPPATASGGSQAADVQSEKVKGDTTPLKGKLLIASLSGVVLCFLIVGVVLTTIGALCGSGAMLMYLCLSWVRRVLTKLRLAFRAVKHRVQDYWTLKTDPPAPASGGSQGADEGKPADPHVYAPAVMTRDNARITLMLACAGIAIALVKVSLALAIVWTVCMAAVMMVQEYSLIKAGRLVFAASLNQQK